MFGNRVMLKPWELYYGEFVLRVEQLLSPFGLHYEIIFYVGPSVVAVIAWCLWRWSRREV